MLTKYTAIRAGACAGLAGAMFVLAEPAQAQSLSGWLSGNWSLTLGGTAGLSPRYRGASGNLAFFGQPIIRIAKESGRNAPFSSRNDGISFALINTDLIRIGPVGRILFQRDTDDRDLRGLKRVPWGAELGGFVDLYPTSWLRFRTELRHGIRAHHGVIADVSADAFWDMTPALRFSAGPRLSWASASAVRPYLGVNAAQSAASGLAPYTPSSGIQSYGFGGAVTWKATDQLTTGLFAEYSRLAGPVADSSLVKQRGSVNQFTFGASATYRFDFRL